MTDELMLAKQQLVAELARLRLRDELETEMTEGMIRKRRVTETPEDNFAFIGDDWYAQKH